MAEFKLIVAGGRDFNDAHLLIKELVCLADVVYHDQNVSIVSGMARGADLIAAHFAQANNVMLYEMPADWTKGRGAGYARNADMAEFADGLLTFWDGESRGTKHMIETMRFKGKPTYVVMYKNVSPPGQTGRFVRGL